MLTVCGGQPVPVFFSLVSCGLCSTLGAGYYYERSASERATRHHHQPRGDAVSSSSLLIIWTTSVRSLPMRSSSGFRIAPYGSIRVVLPGEEGTTHPPGARRRAIVRPPSTEKVNYRGTVGTTRTMGIYTRSCSRGRANQTNLRRDEVPGEADRDEGPFRVIPDWPAVRAPARLGSFLWLRGLVAVPPPGLVARRDGRPHTRLCLIPAATTGPRRAARLVAGLIPLFHHDVLPPSPTGGIITLVVAATIALVMTESRRVLAYSTSATGHMMPSGLAWSAGSGLFHLVTHSLQALASSARASSSIYGCHHEHEAADWRPLLEDEDHTALTILFGFPGHRRSRRVRAAVTSRRCPWPRNASASYYSTTAPLALFRLAAA